MAGFEEQKAQLNELGVRVIGASVDDADKAAAVAAKLSFPIAHGVTKADAAAIGAWWSEERGIVQPSEFIIDGQGEVVLSTYSSGPIGRMLATDVAALIEFYESRKKQR